MNGVMVPARKYRRQSARQLIIFAANTTSIAIPSTAAMILIHGRSFLRESERRAVSE